MFTGDNKTTKTVNFGQSRHDNKNILPKSENNIIKYAWLRTWLSIYYNRGRMYIDYDYFTK